MADVRDLISRDHLDQPSFAGFWRAKIAKPVPTLETSPVYVVIPDIDRSVKWGPCKWTPRSTQATINVAEGAESAHNIQVMIRVLPAFGDDALVVFDNLQNIWVVMYA